MKDINLELVKEVLTLGFDKVKATDEDLIRIANYLGCGSKEVQVCRNYIKEYYYNNIENHSPSN